MGDVREKSEFSPEHLKGRDFVGYLWQTGGGYENGFWRNRVWRWRLGPTETE
jgi:hypothetical protein